jgi:hypothetical protein
MKSGPARCPDEAARRGLLLGGRRGRGLEEAAPAKEGALPACGAARVVARFSRILSMTFVDLGPASKERGAFCLSRDPQFVAPNVAPRQISIATSLEYYNLIP